MSNTKALYLAVFLAMATGATSATHAATNCDRLHNSQQRARCNEWAAQHPNGTSGLERTPKPRTQSEAMLSARRMYEEDVLLLPKGYTYHNRSNSLRERVYNQVELGMHDADRATLNRFKVIRNQSGEQTWVYIAKNCRFEVPEHPVNEGERRLLMAGREKLTCGPWEQFMTPQQVAAARAGNPTARDGTTREQAGPIAKTPDEKDCAKEPNPVNRNILCPTGKSIAKGQKDDVTEQVRKGIGGAIGGMKHMPDIFKGLGK